MEEIEIWKDVIGYEGYYQVSNIGRVKSLDRAFIRSNGWNDFKPSRILVHNLDSKGYIKFSFYKNGVSKTVRLHQLIANAFIPNPNNHKIVRHLDDNKLNNRLDNLAWGSDLDNKADAIRNGKIRKGKNHRFFGRTGELAPDAKIILDTQTGVYYFGTVEVANAKNMVHSTLKNKLNGQRKNNTSLIYC